MLPPSKFSIVWDAAALVTFYRLPIHSATRLDREVMQFAETGRGHIDWVAPYYRLHVGSFYLLLAIDRSAGVLSVLAIRRRHS